MKSTAKGSEYWEGSSQKKLTKKRFLYFYIASRWMFVSSSFYPRFYFAFVCVICKLNKWKDCVLRKQGDGRKTVSFFRVVLQPSRARGWVIWKKNHNDSSMFEFTNEFMSGCVEDSATQHHYKTLEKWSTAKDGERATIGYSLFNKKYFHAVMTNAHDFSLSRDETTFRGSRGREKWAGSECWRRKETEEEKTSGRRASAFFYLSFQPVAFRIIHITKRFLSQNSNACTNKAYLSFRWNPHQSLLRPFCLRCWIVEIASFDTKIFQLRIIAIP